MSINVEPTPAGLSQQDLDTPFDDEATRPVSLQLIARLAANDPAVQLKIGVTSPAVEDAPIGAEKEIRTK